MADEVLQGPADMLPPASTPPMCLRSRVPVRRAASGRRGHRYRARRRHRPLWRHHAGKRARNRRCRSFSPPPELAWARRAVRPAASDRGNPQASHWTIAISPSRSHGSRYRHHARPGQGEILSPRPQRYLQAPSARPDQTTLRATFCASVTKLWTWMPCLVDAVIDGNAGANLHPAIS